MKRIHSIKTKILLLVIFVSILVCGINLWTSVPLTGKAISTLAGNYMTDIVDISGKNIDHLLESSSYEEVMDAANLEAEVEGTTVEGIDSCYAYVVSGDGTMLYHPTPEKIGQPVENAAVKKIVSEIEAGNRLESDVIQYDFKGTKKWASYYVGEQMNFIVVVTADEDEILSSSHAITRRGLEASVFVTIICCILGYVIAFFITKPINEVTKSLTKLADLDFRDEISKKAKKSKDETGKMAMALEKLRESLISVINDISNRSMEVRDAAQGLNGGAQQTTQTLEQVETAINEIADGAASQAKDTQDATENVIVMGNLVEQTDEEVNRLRDNAKFMHEAEINAMEALEQLDKINQQTKEAIDVIASQTALTNESVGKIKEATDFITEIAQETNLLSLNASIEAARAGEAGRGFAVVASQIQKLAEQSNESAHLIEEVINTLIEESEKTVETMEDVKGVIKIQNENVVKTGNAFQDVKTGIEKSIHGVNAISEKTHELDEARIRVVDIVQNLTSIAEENAASTEQTSASATEVVAIMSDVAENAERLNLIADELKSHTEKFTIE